MRIAFFTSFIIAFGGFAAAVAAQKEENEMTFNIFFIECKDNPITAFELLAQKRINSEQLQTFIYDGFYNPIYADAAAEMVKMYWDNIPAQERYDIYNSLFLDDYNLVIDSNYNPLVLTEDFKFLLQHAQQAIARCGKDTFFDYLENKLVNIGSVMQFELSNGEKMNAAQWERTFSPLFVQIKRANSQFEKFAKAFIYTNFVYSPDTELADYFYWKDILLTQYSDDPERLDIGAREAIIFSQDKKTLQMGLKWVNKGVKINQNINCYLTKAKILFLLGKKEQAHQTFEMAVAKVSDNSFFINHYIAEVGQFIGKVQP